MAIEDICGVQWDVVLRYGWHQLESHAGTAFRWAQSDAECVLFTFERVRQRVSFDLEPGPGFGVQPFTLMVFDSNGERKLTEQFTGRKTVSCTVIATKPTVHVLRLHVPFREHACRPSPACSIFACSAFGSSASPRT